MKSSPSWSRTIAAVQRQRRRSQHLIQFRRVVHYCQCHRAQSFQFQGAYSGSWKRHSRQKAIPGNMQTEHVKWNRNVVLCSNSKNNHEKNTNKTLSDISNKRKNTKVRADDKALYNSKIVTTTAQYTSISKFLTPEEAVIYREGVLSACAISLTIVLVAAMNSFRRACLEWEKVK